MEDIKRELDKWTKLWDKVHQEKIEQKEAGRNFFGGQRIDAENKDVYMREVKEWRRLLGKSTKIGSLMSEENEDHLASGPGKGVKFTQNPVHFASHGMDQSPSPNEPTRVTPNFTDGPELRELSDLKIKLEKLESSLLAADINGEGKKDYKSQLDSLRKKIDDLSGRLTPEPIIDNT